MVLSILAAALVAVDVANPLKARSFGGFGFQHPEATLSALMSDEFRDERAVKSFREIRPSFGRVYVGFSFSTKAMMDRFADYYDLTFRLAGTDLYAVPCAMIPEFPERVNPDEYAEKVAAALEYLVKVRRCDRIRYYCLTNELVVNGKWNWFEKSGNMPLYRAYNVALKAAFKRHGLDIALLGNDVAVTLKPYDAVRSLQWTADNMDDVLGVYCTHWYVYARKTEDLGLWSEYGPYFTNLVSIAEAKGKRYILGEWGFHPAWGKRGVMLDDVNPYRRCPSNRTETVLAKLEVGLAAMNAGADGCIDWSFCDYPDPFVLEDGDTESERAVYECGIGVWTPDVKYNKCGVFAWNSVDRDYSSCEELYTMGYMAKLFRKGVEILDVKTADPMLRCGAVCDRKRGSVSVVLINRGEAKKVEVSLPEGAAKGFRVYEYAADNVPWNAFNDLQPPREVLVVTKTAAGCKLTAALSPRSVTFLTTDYEDRTPKPVTGIGCRDGKLVWEPSDDSDLAYYRVYANGRQIASTVATSLSLSRFPTLCADPNTVYSVRAVDRWGNLSANDLRDK